MRQHLSEVPTYSSLPSSSKAHAPQRRRALSGLLRANRGRTDPDMDIESRGLINDTDDPSTSDSAPPQQSLNSLTGFLEGPVVLIAVAFFWGTFSPALKALYETPGPPDAAVLTAVRTTIQAAGLWVSSILVGNLKQEEPIKSKEPITRSLIWRGGLEMGFWNFVANSLQAVGLEYTTALRGGFIIAVTSILTPLLALFAGEWPTMSIWIGSIIGFGSTLLISADSPPDPSGSVHGIISFGDAAVFGAAFFYSVATVRLSYWAQHLPVMKLASAKSIILAGLSLAWMGGIAAVKAIHGEDLKQLWAGAGGVTAWLLVLWSALGAGAVSIYLQTLGQSKVPSSQAQIYYSTTPVWSALLALAFMGETMGVLGWFGGGGLVLAGLLASSEPF